MLGRPSTGWWAALSLPFLLAASPPAAAPAPAPGELTARYDVYASGFPILSLDFNLRESAAAYDVAGLVRTQGALGLVSDFTLRTESRGAIAADQHGKVWIVPSPRAGVPPLPSRVEFRSDWRPITVQMAQIGFAK